MNTDKPLWRMDKQELRDEIDRLENQRGVILFMFLCAIVGIYLIK